MNVGIHPSPFQFRFTSPSPPSVDPFTHLPTDALFHNLVTLYSSFFSILMCLTTGLTSFLPIKILTIKVCTTDQQEVEEKKTKSQSILLKTMIPMDNGWLA